MLISFHAVLFFFALLGVLGILSLFCLLSSSASSRSSPVSRVSRLSLHVAPGHHARGRRRVHANGAGSSGAGISKTRARECAGSSAAGARGRNTTGARAARTGRSGGSWACVGTHPTATTLCAGVTPSSCACAPNRNVKRAIIITPSSNVIGLRFGHQIGACALGDECALNGGVWEISATDVHLSKTGQKIFGVDALARPSPRDMHLLISQGHAECSGAIISLSRSSCLSPSRSSHPLARLTFSLVSPSRPSCSSCPSCPLAPCLICPNSHSCIVNRVWHTRVWMYPVGLLSAGQFRVVHIICRSTAEGLKALAKLDITNISMRSDSRELSPTPLPGTDTANNPELKSDAGLPQTTRHGHGLHVDVSPPPQALHGAPVRIRYAPPQTDTSAVPQNYAGRTILPMSLCKSGPHVTQLPSPPASVAMNSGEVINLRCNVAAVEAKHFVAHDALKFTQEKLGQSGQALQRAVRRANIAKAILVDEQEEVKQLRYQMQESSRTVARERELRMEAEAALKKRIENAEAALHAERQGRSAEMTSARAEYEHLQDRLKQVEAALAAEQWQLKQAETWLRDERQRWGEEIANARAANQLLEWSLQIGQQRRDRDSADAQAVRQKLEDTLTDERMRRETAEWEAAVAERTLADVERECREPFVVPALLAAMRKMSRMTLEAMGDSSV